MQKLLVVLGKRLSDDQLTLEGQGRVEALVDYLLKVKDPSLVIAFSGGVTQGNSVSEAQVMVDYFFELIQAQKSEPLYHSIILEQESLSTVQNVQNIAEKIVESELFSSEQPVELTFISNDYHLSRMMQIQQWMDEQGLLRVLTERAKQVGIELIIGRSLSDHIVLPYPHTSLAGELFLLVDEMTPYRVLLEGILAQVFERELLDVAQPSHQMALEALTKIKVLLASNDDFPMLEVMLPVLERTIEQSHQELYSSHFQERKPSEALISSCLAFLDTNLTLLNRYTDPEVQCKASWWK
ncbi:YdcF family protein [Vibrio maerlii]|uniref:YdcF family protein n=1 Tax=Vibrio maerlii TaxID=2231648 RepID=UPI000E3DEB08|nr:YdcF family protein [Vibrio maerlii]